MGKNHAFVRLLKPYKCHCEPCGANEYAFKRFYRIIAKILIHHQKSVPSTPCYQIAPSYRKCSRTPMFTRSARPYKYHLNACGTIRYTFEMFPTNRCYNIKNCAGTLIREVGKAIITSFRRVLSQCFYVLESLRWCLHQIVPSYRKVCSYPHVLYCCIQ